ncbi:putative Cation efflux system protein CusF [Pseudomonas sp. 8BK]|uniref:copper-binding protein n=1 Tax=Pseudomonas sp. 8BK TaxID=2653164 RepID=UPI0012F284AA|nr:copper-binding protein [Pseudomonas sp. 8BK]VXB78925.1 putative Cation efflux system protein CusF [Pseudomonas sp. 8BK]
MKQLLIACLLGSLAFSVQASDEQSGHKGHEVAQANTSMSQGEVRKIDAANLKITLRHGPLANIGMPPMTMVFQVQDAAQLEGLKVGDKVSFVAQQQGSQFVASELQAVQP